MVAIPTLVRMTSLSLGTVTTTERDVQSMESARIETREIGATIGATLANGRPPETKKASNPRGHWPP